MLDFLLEPDVVFLNHGSFGACPRVVHDEYQRFQRRLESQPVRFLQRELPALMDGARQELATWLGASADEVVFVANPTYAVNEIIRSLPLGEGDEVVTSNQEYGACLNAWQFMSERSGFSMIEAPIPVPVEPSAIADLVWDSVSSRTKVIFLSHITSTTALTIPVADICRRARGEGITTIIDGAHVPGQMELDVTDVGADFYVGACHKWLCAPKGSSFFYARREVQRLIEPLVVGWGWGVERQFDSGCDFLDGHEWLGTDDPSAFLTVPAAIRFQREHDWPTVRSRCHQLVIDALDRAAELPGIERIHDNDAFVQMGLLEISPRRDESGRERSNDASTLQARLYEEGKVEVPVVSWTDPSGAERVFVRLSVQAYNTSADVDAFVETLEATTSR